MDIFVTVGLHYLTLPGANAAHPWSSITKLGRALVRGLLGIRDSCDKTTLRLFPLHDAFPTNLQTTEYLRELPEAAACPSFLEF